MVSLKIGKVFTYGKNLLKGTKYGGVQVGNKLTLIPSDRLTKFVDDANKHGFDFDVVKSISPEKTQEFMRRLGTAGKTKAPINFGSNLRYTEAHGWTQIYDQDNGKVVVNLVERLKHPTKEYLKHQIKNIFG